MCVSWYRVITNPTVRPVQHSILPRLTAVDRDNLMAPHHNLSSRGKAIDKLTCRNPLSWRREPQTSMPCSCCPCGSCAFCSRFVVPSLPPGGGAVLFPGVGLPCALSAWALLVPYGEILATPPLSWGLHCQPGYVPYTTVPLTCHLDANPLYSKLIGSVSVVVQYLKESTCRSTCTCCAGEYQSMESVCLLKSKHSAVTILSLKTTTWKYAQTFWLLMTGW